MKSLHVVGPAGERWLMLRDYACQGERPDYDRLCRLDEFEAISLVSGKIAAPWSNDADFSGQAGDPLRFLVTVAEGAERWVRLRLPNRAPRSSAFELDLPEGKRIVQALRARDDARPEKARPKEDVGPASPKRPRMAVERWI